MKDNEIRAYIFYIFGFLGWNILPDIFKPTGIVLVLMSLGVLFCFLTGVIYAFKKE